MELFAIEKANKKIKTIAFCLITVSKIKKEAALFRQPLYKNYSNPN